MNARRYFLILNISLGMMLNPINSSLLSVGIVRIQNSFALEFAVASWLILIFYLCSIISQPIMGKLGDVFGHKKIYLSGLTLVFIASVLVSFVTDFWMLVALRGLMAVGTSAVFPTGMAQIRHHITEGQSKALGIVSIFSNASTALGPALGGIIIHWWDWQGIFAINIPLVLICMVCGIWLLPKDTGAGHSQAPSSRQELMRLLDMPGIMLFAVSVACGLLFFTAPFKFNAVVGMIGLCAIAAFVWREQKVQTPFIPLRIIRRNRPMMWVILQQMVSNLVFYSIFLGFPVYLLSVRSFNEQITGLIMLCFAGVTIFMSPIAGLWIDRSGYRPVLIMSAVLLTLGTLGMLLLQESTPIYQLCILLSFMGIGAGLLPVGLQSALLENAPKEIIGTATGIFATSRFMGAISASLLMGAVFGAVLTTDRFRILGLLLVLLSFIMIWIGGRISQDERLAGEADEPQTMRMP